MNIIIQENKPIRIINKIILMIKMAKKFYKIEMMIL